MAANTFALEAVAMQTVGPKPRPASTGWQLGTSVPVLGLVACRADASRRDCDGIRQNASRAADRLVRAST